MFLLILRGRRERGGERETLIHCLPYVLEQGTNPQPRYVPWPGIQLQPFGMWDNAPTNWPTQPGHKALNFKTISLRIHSWSKSLWVTVLVKTLPLQVVKLVTHTLDSTVPEPILYLCALHIALGSAASPERTPTVGQSARTPAHIHSTDRQGYKMDFLLVLGIRRC